MKETPHGFIVPKMKFDELDEKAKDVLMKWVDHLVMDTKAGAEISDQLVGASVEERKMAIITLLEKGNVAIEIRKDLGGYRWLVLIDGEYQPFR